MLHVGSEAVTVNHTMLVREEAIAEDKPILAPDFLRQIEHLALTVRRAHLGAAKGERRSKRKGPGIEFADYRDYVQGDELRHVDWNLLSRLDALYLRLFEDQEDVTIHLLIDASASMGYGTPTKLGFACKLAAAIGYIALAGHDRVTAQVFSRSGHQTLPPVRGKASARKLFAFLQSVGAGGATHLEAACHQHLARTTTPGIVILISDFFDGDGYEACLRKLAASRSDVYAIHVLAREELEPDVTGDLKLIDSETGQAVDVSINHALLRRYHADVERFRESVRRSCLNQGIGHIMAAGDLPIEHLTLDLLRRSGMVR
jgi:uncharacterized protein (DUF58 family)